MLSFIPRIAPGGKPAGADWMSASPTITTNSNITQTEYLVGGTPFFSDSKSFALSQFVLPANFEEDFISMRMPTFTLSALSLPATYEAKQ